MARDIEEFLRRAAERRQQQKGGQPQQRQPAPLNSRWRSSNQKSFGGLPPNANRPPSNLGKRFNSNGKHGSTTSNVNATCGMNRSINMSDDTSTPATLPPKPVGWAKGSPTCMNVSIWPSINGWITTSGKLTTDPRSPTTPDRAWSAKKPPRWRPNC